MINLRTFASVRGMGKKNGFNFGLTFLTVFRMIKKWKFTDLPANKDTAIVSLFLLAYLLFHLFGDLSLALKVPPDIYFSTAVMEGADVGKRANSLYWFVIAAVGLYFIIYPLMYFLFRWIRIKNKQLQTLMVLSITGFFSVFSTLIGWNSALMSHTLLIIIFVKIVLFALANLKKGQFRMPGNEIYINISLALAFIIYFAFTFLFNSHPLTRGNFLLWFPVFVFATVVIIPLVKHYSGLSNRTLFLFMAWFGFIPLFAFIAGESVIFFKLKYDLLIRFKYLFIAFSMAGILFTGVFVFLSKSNPKLSGRKLLEWFLLSSVLLCMLILAYYDPFPKQSSEIFELANPANSMLRFFAHGQIPFIDYMSSHMISEQWYGMIYHALFGFDTSLDFRTYEFFNRIVIAFVIYLFLNRIFIRKELTLLFMVSFAFVFTIFFVHIILAVLLYFLSIRVLEKQNPANYALLFLTVFLLFIWRLDTGSAGLITIVFFIPMLFLISREKPQWFAMVKAGAITAVIILVSLMVSMMLRSPEYISENFLAALHYAKSNLAHGYSTLARSHPHQFYIYHYFFPLVSLIAIVVTVALLRRNTFSIASAKISPALAGIFLLILYLANGQRGLVRHSFMSGSEMFLASTFFTGFALFITFIIERAQRNTNRYFVFLSSAFLLFVLLKFFPLSNTDTFSQIALSKPSYAQFDLNFNEERLNQRTLPDHSFQESMYRDLKSFLDDNLSPDQTFLDFSNTPMLYYYCERKIPGYFNQNLQNTVVDYLQLHLLQQIDPVSTPVVVFSNVPSNWFDATDGVPNVMRYYLVAEYIFEHYIPFGIINKKSIWVAKGHDNFTPLNTENHYTTQIHQFNYKKSAHFAGQYYHHNKPDGYETAWQWQVPDEYIPGKVSVDLPEQATEVKNGWIYIMLDSDHPQQDVWLNLIKGEKVIGKYTFDILKGRRYYLLRPGNHYNWINTGADKLELELRKGMYLKDINILKDNRLENRNTDIH